MTAPTRFKPPDFSDFHTQLKSDPEGVSQRLHQSLQLVYQQLYSTKDSVRSGSVLVTGKKESFPTGLVKVNDCQATIDNGSVATNLTVTVRPSKIPGCIDIYVWKPTALADTTPIPATTVVTVRWNASTIT